MRGDANFSIGVIKIQVKEEREIDKSYIILMFWCTCCRNSRKRWKEKLTSILSIELPKFNCHFAYVRFFFSLVFRLVSFFIVYFCLKNYFT